MEIKNLSHQILRDLYGGSRRLSMYPLGHPITHTTLNKPLDLLKEIFEVKRYFIFEMLNNRIIAEGILLGDLVYIAGLAADMKKHNLHNFVLKSDVQIGDLYHFLTMLVSKPGPDENHFSKELKGKNISAIKVNVSQPRTLFIFEGFDQISSKSDWAMEERIFEILKNNPKVIAAYYLGKIKDDDDLYSHLQFDLKLNYVKPFFKRVLLTLDEDKGLELLEDLILSTNWVGDNEHSISFTGLKKLIKDYLSKVRSDEILGSIYEILKQVGLPNDIIERLFDDSKVIKIKAFKDSELIVNVLKYSDPSTVDPEGLAKTVTKLALSNQIGYINELTDQLLKSVTSSTGASRQKAVHLVAVVGQVFADGGHDVLFNSLCRDTISIALMPSDIREPVELAVQLAWQALKTKKWRELKHITKTLRGLVSDKSQPANKRSLAAKQIQSLSESKYFDKYINEILEKRWSEESGAFFEAFSNLGSKEIVKSLTERIADPDINVRSIVVKLLTEMKKESAEVLTQILAEKTANSKPINLSENEWYYYRNILRVIREIRAEEALPYLELMAGWPDERIKIEIIKTLEGMPVASSAKLLEKFTADPDYDVRKAAVVAMGLTGHPDMVDRLKKVFISNEDCRVLAVAAMGRIGGPSARDTLIDIFENKALYESLDMSKNQISDIRSAIIKSLARIGDDVAVVKLEEYSRDSSYKTLFNKDILSNTARMVLGIKNKF